MDKETQRSIPFIKFYPLSRLGWVVLIFGIFLSIVTSIKDYRSLEMQKKIAFESENANIQLRIKNRLESHENILLQVRAYLINNQNITRAQFHKYVQDSLLLEKYPGIKGLSLTKKVYHKDLKSFVGQIQAADIKRYKVWPETNNEVHFPIVYFEPLIKRNEGVIGFDVYSDPTRKEVMDLARDSGIPKLSKKVFLANEPINDKKIGLILYLPIYKSGMDTQTIEGRKKAINGYVSSAIKVKELFSNIFADTKLNVDFEIFDGPIMNPGSLLFDYDSIPHYEKKNFKPAFSTTQLFEVSGQTFTLFVNSEPQFQKRHKSNNYLWILASGLFITLLLTWIIASTKKQSEDLLVIEKALREAVSARDQFLSIASHELRNPMTALKLHSQIMKRRMDKTEDLNNDRGKLEKAMDQIEDQVTALNRLIDDMLDISRYRSGNLKIELSEFDLAEVIHEVVHNLAEQMAASGNPPPTIEIEGDLKGKWDKMRIGQVITNLMTNAIRYGNQKTIKIKAQGLNDSVKVSVTDQGIGISSEDQERIFGQFERATSSNEANGLGLGLFISKQIILTHKGKIWVESKLGEGSTFFFEVPKK